MNRKKTLYEHTLKKIYKIKTNYHFSTGKESGAFYITIGSVTGDHEPEKSSVNVCKGNAIRLQSFVSLLRTLLCYSRVEGNPSQNVECDPETVHL